ncbi:HNH endonuclease [Halorubrum vacuolatum]|uniref:HNH endonuclease n=1 Tax=Halorubrum vacuolatum TaxID=63740 RepID=A0A238XDS3_HALVU|nr:HNH endonuclease signature motif containing protein [Halorubrum vacuolatum]SNR56663.1 HNH endonuclease [Halorubrum vacuolatum]
MSQTEPRDRSDSGDSGEQEAAGDADEEADVRDPHECHETVDSETRAEALERDGHRCQVCGRCGPERGGLATLHIHHIERDPDGMDEDDPRNLTTLCRSCHSWIHQQASPDESPVSLSEDDLTVLLAQDIEMLRFLAEDGPARTGDIAAGLTADLSVSAVRERLWVLMGLDNIVESRDRQIVDKDIETGEWGLTGQIETSARGHIPDDPQLLLQRMEDEQVRQALERGCDRHSIMDVFGVSRRTTFHKEKRACAYGFPLEAFSRGGPQRGGDDHDRKSPSDRADDTAEDEQQQLDAVVDSTNKARKQAETVGVSGAGDVPNEVSTTTQSDRNAVVVRNQLETAIEALEEVQEAL